MTEASFNQALLARFAEQPAAPAIRYKLSGAYRTMTYGELAVRCRDVASGLADLGLERGERLAIYAANAREWVVSDFGGLLAGAVCSAIHSGSSDNEVAYILNDLGARYVFVDDDAKLAQIERLRDRLELAPRVISFRRLNEPPAWSLSLDELERLGRRARGAGDQWIERLASTLTRDDLALVIYTSGTAGDPKGAMISHGNLLAFCRSAGEHFGRFLPLVHQGLGFLPLSHAFERLGGLYLLVYHGRSTAYAESLDTLLADMQAVRPDVMAAVPRFFEKIHERVQHELEHASPPRRALFDAALAHARRRRQNEHAGLWRRTLGALASFLVTRQMQAIFGGRLQFFISGGAPLSPSIAQWLEDLGMRVLEGWGATETTAAATLNHPDDRRVGSVGKPLPGVELAVADDGELLIRGPNIAQGYWHRPELTRAVFSETGYYCSGDVGERDSDGFVYITGRKKDLIVTAGGKKLAPTAIEEVLVRSPLIDHALIHGDRRRYLTALLALNEPAMQRIAGEQDYGELTRDPRVLDATRRVLETANAGLSHYAQVQYFRLVPKPFTTEDGELTHTLKLRREIIEDRYRGLLEGMYSDSEEAAS